VKARIGVGIAVAALATSLFAAGALSPLAPQASRSSQPASPGSAAALAAATADGEAVAATVAALQNRIRDYGPDSTSLASLGLAYLQQARITADPSYYPKAEGTLRRSLQLNDSDNFSALLGMGILAAARHDFREALMWGRQARATNPYSADVRGLIGDSLIELGRYHAAGRSFQAMVNLRPDASSYARVSYFRELHGDTRGAINAMKLADDASLGATADAAWVAYQLGELYFNSGRLQDARREYARGIWLSPEYAPSRAGLARVAAARGNLRRATSMLEEVVETYPSTEYVILLGDVHQARGRTRKSLAQYELAEAIAQLYERNGVDTDVEMALFAVDRGVGASQSVAKSKAAFKQRPSVHAADALAWGLYAKGNYEAAGRLSERALRLGTKNALFLFHRGMIERRLGHPQKAARFLSAALRINPHFSLRYGHVARTALSRLTQTAPR
jgi:tetratricopeptide (TPR) repeat protein